jgi:carbamoyltransferase
MHVLGISCYYHDAAAALLADGLLVAAAEEERFTRKKHDYGFPKNAIRYCLESAGISGPDLDYVVFYEKPLPKFERILLTSLHTVPRSWSSFREAMITWLNDKLWIKSHIVRELGVRRQQVLFAEHHVSHAASALFCSPFSEAAIVTADGVGEWTTTTVGRGCSGLCGERASLTLENEVRFPHSLGLLYSAFTAYLGFEVNDGEYKVMGMAPYGQPRYVDKVRQLIDVKEDGSFQLAMGYFSFQYSTDRTFSDRFVELFGPARQPGAEFITRLTHPDVTGRDAEMERNQHYADVAASIQRVTEDIMLKLANHAHHKTGLKYLCMAGGVALNSVANGLIERQGPFDELYIQPAAGDSGGALGAALYAYHILLGKPRQFIMEHAYWGQAYNEAEIVRTLKEAGLAYETFEDDDRLLDRVVDSMVGGEVVGWFQGGFEWGPRALGNRSILADPRRADMKEIVNRKIKFREPFRPFAPAVPIESTQQFFELQAPERNYPARFMLLVTPVNAKEATRIPAVNHLGTARLQTVRQKDSPRYYSLIQRFGEATGVPVVLNTSFNLRGEPIVNTPAEALNTFRASGMELLVLDNVLVRRHGG